MNQRSRLTCIVLTLAMFATLIKASGGKPVCDQPVPLVRRITDRDGDGTHVFISPFAMGASYRFVFDPQSGKTGNYFKAYFRYILKDGVWVMQLTKPLDPELINSASSQGLILSVNIYCTLTGGSNKTTSQPRLPYARLIHIRRVDEFDPVLSDEKAFTVREDAPVESVVARLERLFTDADFSGKPTIVDTFISKKYEGDKVDGSDVFQVSENGDVILKRPLDYDHGDKVFGLGIVGHDFHSHIARSAVEARVINLDDNPPVFLHTGCLAKCSHNNYSYSAIVGIFYLGRVTSFAFGPIQAVDADGDTIEYSLTGGSQDDYQSYVAIDKQNGSLYIIKLFKYLDSNLEHLDIRIQAKSVSKLAKSRAVNVSDLAETSIQLWPTLVLQQQANTGADGHKQPGAVFLYLLGISLAINLRLLC